MQTKIAKLIVLGFESIKLMSSWLVYSDKNQKYFIIIFFLVTNNSRIVEYAVIW